MDWPSRGCLWWFVKVAHIVYAIWSIAMGEGNLYSWAILALFVMYILLKILYYGITRNDYNRKDSYWSKKEESEDTTKTDK